MSQSLPPPIPRRRFGRHVLLGVGATAGAAVFVGRPDAAQAAPATDPWRLGGNSGVTTTGSNFLGTNNVAPLIFKTAAVSGSPIERMRVRPTGQLDIKGSVGIGVNAAPTNRLTVNTASTSGTAIRATAPSNVDTAPNAVGVHGVATYGVMGDGDYAGVQGLGPRFGVFGYSVPDTGGVGVYGAGRIGVLGSSNNGSAVLGYIDAGTGPGVKGETYSDGPTVNAIWGQAFGVDNTGVVGEASYGTSAYGVWGISTSGIAGMFSGDVNVTGTLTKSGGSFKIDHPVDPASKYLSHSFVESPDMMNVYNGNVTTDAGGKATVTLPDYFEALNRSFRYQLTVIGQFAQAIVANEISGGRFDIATDRPRVKVSWQVTGVRKDAWANAHRIPVEETKPASERGTYLHPGLHSEPETLDVQYERLRSLHADQQPRPAPVPR